MCFKFTALKLLSETRLEKIAIKYEGVGYE